jgi:hypothetical protein
VPRFPLFTDNHVRQQLIDGLVLRGWDVQRAIDLFPERTVDPVLFSYAAEHKRVLVTNDNRVTATAERWLEEGKPFTGLIVWELEHHRRLSEGWFIRKFEELAEEDDPFFYHIRHLNPD